jgi:hypothetical protein
MKFDRNMAAIHAYLCADGYVIKNPKRQKQKYYYIGLRNTDEVLLSDFEKKFYNYFKIVPRRGKDGRTVVQNKATYLFLTQDFSYYSREWVLPKLSKENLKIWLRAFFDCEAWVFSIKAKDRHIGVDSINKKGLLSVKESLLIFGINTKLKKRKDRNIYRLYIYGKDNLIKFQKHINFLHPRKRKKLQEAIDTYIN